MSVSNDFRHSTDFACFAPLICHTPPPLPIACDRVTPPALLYGNNPTLLSGLLSSIRSEAINRKLAFSALYDPYLPHRLTDLWVEGIGSFTLSPQLLTTEGGLIDCTVPALEADESVHTALQELSTAMTSLAKEISSVGRLLADAKSILATQGERLCTSVSLRAKAERIAKKLPRKSGTCAKRTLAIQSYDESGAITLLPFPKEIRILGLPSRYSLSSIFLRELEAALIARNCEYILLTAAFTGERLGILLPASGICYLTDAPEELREKELTLSRFLLPFTPKERRDYRRLSAATKAIEAHLCLRLADYRAFAMREKELHASLYQESRLQNFRKRLLIDLFCS